MTTSLYSLCRLPDKPVYFCPPTAKYADLPQPPPEEKTALSYAGADTEGNPIFWTFTDGEWNKQPIILTARLHPSPPASMDTPRVENELYLRLICSPLEKWPDILKEYEPHNSVPDFLRANKDCICESCKRPYWQHEYDLQYPTPSSMWVHANRPEYFLHKLCDGTLVKL